MFSETKQTSSHPPRCSFNHFTAPAEEQCSTKGYGCSIKLEEGTAWQQLRAGFCLQHGHSLAVAWLLLTDNFTLDLQWVSSVLVSLPRARHFLSKKKTLYSVSYVVKKDIWEDRLCSLLLLAQCETGFNLQCTNLCITTPQTHLWMPSLSQ